MEIAAPADLHDQYSHPGIVQCILNGVALCSPRGVGPDFNINGQTLFDRPLFGGHTDGNHTVNSGDEDLVHRLTTCPYRPEVRELKSPSRYRASTRCAPRRPASTDKPRGPGAYT